MCCSDPVLEVSARSRRISHTVTRTATHAYTRACKLANGSYNGWLVRGLPSSCGSA